MINTLEKSVVIVNYVRTVSIEKILAISLLLTKIVGCVIWRKRI